jgi:hypothetical protein
MSDTHHANDQTKNLRLYIHISIFVCLHRHNIPPMIQDAYGEPLIIHEPTKQTYQSHIPISYTKRFAIVSLHINPQTMSLYLRALC